MRPQGTDTGSASSVGAILTTMPPHCTYVGGGENPFYDGNGMWLKPSYGANGVFYRVVPARNRIRAHS